MDISFDRCAHCRVAGADVHVPRLLSRRVCSTDCLRASTGGSPLPPSIASAHNLGSGSRMNAATDGLVCAALWLAEDFEDLEARSSELVRAVPAAIASVELPLSQSPVPFDVQAYNALSSMMRTTIRYVTQHAPVEPHTACNIPSEHIENIAAHTGALPHLYVKMWRQLLVAWDEGVAAAGANKVAAEAAVRASRNDVRRMLAHLDAEMTAYARTLLERLDKCATLMRHDMVRLLVDGLFRNIPLNEQKPSVLFSPQEATSMSSALIGSNHNGFIDTVASVEANVFSRAYDYSKAHVKRGAGTLSSLGNTYNWVRLADLLYKVHLVNVCSPEIAAATKLTLPDPFENNSSAPAKGTDFKADSYDPAYGNAESGWPAEYLGYVDAALKSVGTYQKSRNERIKAFTCDKSSSAKIQVGEYSKLAAEIARHVHGMYYFLYQSGKPDVAEFTKRRAKLNSDFQHLAKELTRKVGLVRASEMLTVIAPPATQTAR